MTEMRIWIALLRGINVGGRHKLPMQALRDLLADAGSEKVRTYIQSGNCAFEHAETEAAALAATIGVAIERRFGFRPEVFLLTPEALDGVLAANPYADRYDEPNQVHVFLLAEPARDADLETLEALRAPSEDFTLTDEAFYLFAPEGIGRSRLAERLARHIRVSMTARNLRTLLQLAEMAREAG